MNHKGNRKNLWFSIAIAVSTVAVTLVDFNTPRGMAIGILYVVPTALSLWLPRRQSTFIIGAVNFLLVITGYLVSPPGTSPIIFVLINRGLSLVAITILMIIGTLPRATEYFTLMLQKKHAEEILEEMETRFYAVMESGGQVGVAFVILQDKEGKEGVHIFCNDTWPLVTGYSQEELLEISFVELIPPDEREVFLNSYRRRMAGENVFPELLDMSIIKKDGSMVPVEFTLGWIAYQGRYVVIATIKDITERKKAENTLTVREKQLSLLFDNVGDVIFVLSVEPDDCYRFIMVNHRFQEATGLSENQVVGKRIEEVIPEPAHALVLGKYKEAIQIGQPARWEEVSIYPTGKKVGEVAVAPMFDANGICTQLVGTVHDITEQKQLEEQLELAAREWGTTFDSISDWVSVHDKDFRIFRINRAFAEALKMDHEAIIGRPCYEVIHGEHGPSEQCAHRIALETMQPYRREFFNPHLGIHMEVLCSPIFNDDGEAVGTVHIARDITESKKMQAHLMAQDRLASIGQLASGIAHELNNPLTAVIGFSDMLASRKDLPEDVKEDLVTINKEAKRTTSIVKGLLTFARKQKVEKEPVDIRSIIGGVLQLRSYEQRVSNIEVDIRFAPDLPQVMGNGAQLQQVVINIVVNAEQAMLEAHNRGKLTIVTERVGDMVRVSFTDDGPGISPENSSKLFTPFFTTKEVGKGTGLGLSICHGVITEHGGRIYAESESSKGATFIVELPISK